MNPSIAMEPWPPLSHANCRADQPSARCSLEVIPNFIAELVEYFSRKAGPNVRVMISDYLSSHLLHAISRVIGWCDIFHGWGSYSWIGCPCMDGWEYSTGRVQHISNPGSIIFSENLPGIIKFVSLFVILLICIAGEHVLCLRFPTRTWEFTISFLYTHHASNWLLSSYLSHWSRITGVYIMWPAVVVRCGISIRKFAYGFALHASGRHPTTS